MTKVPRLRGAAPEEGNPGPGKSGTGFFARHSSLVVFWVCLIFVTGFATSDALLRSISHGRVTAIQTSDVPASAISVSQGARIRSTILPPTGMDSRWWVTYTEELLRGDAWRIRHTELDNFPVGREVHWSSGLIWLLAGLAQVVSLATGKPAVDCVPDAACWYAPVLLAMCLALLGLLAKRSLGLGVAGVFLLIFTTSPPVYQCFRTGEPDHHGIVCTLAVASVLCLVAGGGGIVRIPKRRDATDSASYPLARDVRRWFIGAGVLGGAALWVSAASYIPIQAGCAVGAVLAALVRDRKNGEVAPELWRLWAQAGCVSSLFFYALEYFPNHMGWHLEVNHPLYALAWLGAGDLLARVVGWVAGRPLVEKRNLPVLLLSLAALAVPAVLIARHADRVFWVSDRFLLLLHMRFIQEFQSFARTLNDRPFVGVLSEMFAWPLFVVFGAVYLLARRQLSGRWLPMLCVAVMPAVVTFIESFAQIRWTILSMGLWTLCVAVTLAAYFDRRESRSLAFLGIFGVTLLFSGLVFPTLSIASLANIRHLNADLPKAVVPSLLMRDVAHRLVQSSPTRLPVVLAGPTSSTEITYYGGIPTIGTLYWENMEGLKRAARIFAAPSDDEAKARLREARVTHIVSATWDKFGWSYVDLLREAGTEPVAPNEKLLVSRLQPGQVPPDWLRPLYYPIPAVFGIDSEKLLIFQFVENQTHTEALYYRAVFALDAGDFAGAEKLFADALALEPGSSAIREALTVVRDRLKTTKPSTPSPNENSKNSR